MVEAAIRDEKQGRIVWLDQAKALGIILVFYGHLLEALYLNGHTAVFPQFRFIYAFHMPLFFWLAGYVWRERSETWRAFVSYRLRTRIIPFIFFNLLALACLMVLHAGHGGLQPVYYLTGLWAMMRGVPAFNTLTWFLVCLFTVELYHYWGQRWWRTWRQQVIAAGLFLAVGWLVTWYVSFQGPVLLPKNFWYVQEALVAYGFYLLGVVFRQQKAGSNRQAALAAFSFGLITWLTYNRNSGPFVVDEQVVLMAISSHGHWFWFPLTAVSGTLGLIYLAHLLPVNRSLRYLGQNSLVLMGLNGLFFEFFNTRIVASPFWGESAAVVTCQAAVVTILSLLVCLLFAHFINKWIPQLVGKPRRQTNLS